MLLAETLSKVSIIGPSAYQYLEITHSPCIIIDDNVG